MCMSIGFKINARRSHPTICLQIKMQVIFEMPKLPLLAKLVRRHTAALLPEPAHITQRPEFQNILKKYEIFLHFNALYYVNTGCEVFKWKLERFLPQNQHTQRTLLNFENWVNGEVSKSAKI